VALSIPLSDKVDFKTRTSVEDKDRYLIVTKLVTCQKGTNIINRYVSSSKALKCMKQKTDRTRTSG